MGMPGPGTSRLGVHGLRLRRPLAVAILTAGTLGMAWAGATSAVAAATDFRILDDRVAESSGLALSRAHPHTVWTANDSGDSARIFAVDTTTGRTTGVHTFDAPVVDVEALAITPQGRVLVADVGDNSRSRQRVRVFWFDEPALGDTSGSWASWELAYPDGPHDAESLAVDPHTGRVLVVTKGAAGAVYALPEHPSRHGLNRLERLADAPAVATDAVFLADGSALAVRTYTQLVLLDPKTWRPTVSAFLPLQRQGETIALAPDGDGLLVGTEGRRSPVQEVPVPVGATGKATTPTGAAPTPTATPSAGTGPAASATSSSRPHATSSSRPRADRGQLVEGLGAAVSLVLVALLATWVARRAARR
ncbi:hypothetical protein ABEG17_13995 [Pedococcus sp. KACC 23699]|uniref:WD40 repeat domain-containing protein n=1 Tax=Pedococcus sp. KACC 23699 TaxID=3149228 RepID=A0AAU7JQF9_9MICO